MTEHTPTPWRAGHYSSIVGLPISAQPDPKKNTIILCGVRGDRGEAEANAAFIVKAVNSHDALKASLAEMVGIYWGDGDGQEPPPQCIQRAKAVLASIEENV